jgi:hypothetical protein
MTGYTQHLMQCYKLHVRLFFCFDWLMTAFSSNGQVLFILLFDSFLLYYISSR